MTEPRIYRCNKCGYIGPAYGIPSSQGVSAPFCPVCQLNSGLADWSEPIAEAMEVVYDIAMLEGDDWRSNAGALVEAYKDAAVRRAVEAAKESGYWIGAKHCETSNTEMICRAVEAERERIKKALEDSEWIDDEGFLTGIPRNIIAGALNGTEATDDPL